MTKHEQYYAEMLQKHQAEFEKFREVHQQYVLDPKNHKSDFDDKGGQILEIITEYENRLCAHSEKSRYGVYSDKLADKFWGLVRTDFPKIDDVGVEITYEPVRVHPETNRRAKPLLPRPNLISPITPQSPDDFADEAIEAVLNSLKKTKL